MSDFLDHPTSVRQGEELDLTRLDRYLREHFSSEIGALHVRQYPSGHSNLTYSLQLGARELVLRRPPFGSKVKSAHDMSREFRVLSKLHAVYSPAPEVILYCGDEAVLGTPFYLTFARFKLAVIVQQIYYRYHQGLTADKRFASMPERVQLLLRASWECAQTQGI